MFPQWIKIVHLGDEPISRPEGLFMANFVSLVGATQSLMATSLIEIIMIETIGIKERFVCA
jgi:hypothetical protein